jgi:hypothetical protein
MASSSINICRKRAPYTHLHSVLNLFKRAGDGHTQVSIKAGGTPYSHWPCWEGYVYTHRKWNVQGGKGVIPFCHEENVNPTPIQQFFPAFELGAWTSALRLDGRVHGQHHDPAFEPQNLDIGLGFG